MKFLGTRLGLLRPASTSAQRECRAKEASRKGERALSCAQRLRVLRHECRVLRP